MRIIGIDPGVNGAAAAVDACAPFAAPTLNAAIDIPTSGTAAKRRIDVCALMDWILKQNAQAAFIERTGAMPGQGLSSTFLFGRATGALEATIQCARVPLYIVEPSVWKKRFNLVGAAKGGSKEDSRQRALMMFPEQSSLFSRKKDHQRAEAALIAVYGSEITMGVKK